MILSRIIEEAEGKIGKREHEDWELEGERGWSWMWYGLSMECRVLLA
jgi:hypothetical protein